MKNFLIVTRNILVSALVAFAMVMLMWMNLRFLGLTLMRYDAIDMFACGLQSAAEEQYNDSLSLMNEFSSEGDYQKWLVSSGSTYTGKLVRTLIMAAEFMIFIVAIKAIQLNILYSYKRIKKKIRHKLKYQPTRI